LTLVVPPEVDSDYTTQVILTHPYTKFERVLPVTFSYSQQKEKPVQKKTVKSQQEPEYEEMAVVKTKKSDSKGWGTYLAMASVLIATFLFIAK
jgi:hypothetical protein